MNARLPRNGFRHVASQVCPRRVSMKNYCVGVLLCFLIASRSFAQCPLPPNNQFKPFKRVEDKPSGHFEWYSAAGENPTQGGGHPTHVFDRKVTNLSNTTFYVRPGNIQNGSADR